MKIHVAAILMALLTLVLVASGINPVLVVMLMLHIVIAVESFVRHNRLAQHRRTGY